MCFKNYFDVKNCICTHCNVDEYCSSECEELERVKRFIYRFGIDEFNRFFKEEYDEDINALMKDFKGE